MVPNSQSITRFDCHAALCQPDDIQECWWIQKVTGEVWIGLEHNIIDTAVNDRRNNLCGCGHVMSWHFKHFFTVGSWKPTAGWTVSPSDKNVKDVLYVLFWLSNNASLDRIQYFVGSAFARYCKNRHWVRWEIKRSFDGQLCQKYFRQKIINIW